MNNRRSYLLVGTAVFMVAVGMRTIPLYWSYLPFNLDGFQFAAPARYTLAHGHLPNSSLLLQADQYSFSVLLTIVSRLTGISPLQIAQLLIAFIGSIPCLVAVILVRRIGLQCNWQFSQIRLAACVAGLVLSIEGIYLGRSAAVTSEGVGIVLVALLAFAFYRSLLTCRYSWMTLSLLFVFMLPLTHVLATIEGILVVTALLALSVPNSDERDIRFGILLVIAFWSYIGGYYSILKMNEMGRLATYPGLLLAWIIVLIILCIWIRTTGERFQRGLPLGVLSIGCVIFILNHFVTVFPGTAKTPTLIILLTTPLAFASIFASWGLPYAVTTNTDGEIVVAMLFGPLVLVGFALTGSLTIAYQDIIARGQIFLHLSLVVLLSLAIIAISDELVTHPKIARAFLSMVITLLLLGSVVSAPLAFLGLHATPAQPVTRPNEFEATTFSKTYIHDQWASDGQLSRLASYYYPVRTNSTYTPVYQWLASGSNPPPCTVVSQHSWTTVGAQLFPASPKQIGGDRYQFWLMTQQVIYASGGDDSITISQPIDTKGTGCQP